MDIKKTLGKRIQNYRKLKKITQDKLAEIVGIDTISLSKIETGKNYPTAENLSKIANILDVNIYELFIEEKIKDNEDLLNEIQSDLQIISKDNQKLHVVYTTLKSILA
ncbi:helix-turn-helix transcriptional regulator [bacterium]|nr:helix-turn-helix transcriptional regulator [bacterium]